MHDPDTKVRSFAPTLLWIGLVFASAAIGYHIGESRLRARDGGDRGRPAAAYAAATSATPTNTEVASTPRVTDRTPPHDEWQTLHARPDTAERDRQLAEVIEHLARTEPQRALALAAAEKNWRLRELLRDASVKGWASVAPEAATEWTLALKPAERRGAIAALFEGAAQQPEKAVAVAERVVAAEPESSSSYGHLAIDALGRIGAFQTAAELATRLAATDASLLSAAYLQWAEREPDAATSALGAFSDAALRRSALEGVVNGWAACDPEQLARHSALFPADERPVALSAALSRWAERDPIAATAWIEANDPGQDADDGIATVTQQSSLAESSPETALHWASLIVDPAKRATAEQSVLSRWAARSPAAARQYAETLANPTDRAAALAVLPPPPN